MFIYVCNLTPKDIPEPFTCQIFTVFKVPFVGTLNLCLKMPHTEQKTRIQSDHPEKISHVANCMCCKLHMLQISGTVNCTFCKFYLIQIACVANCTCCKLHILQIARVANCTCCKFFTNANCICCKLPLFQIAPLPNFTFMEPQIVDSNFNSKPRACCSI